MPEAITVSVVPVSIPACLLAGCAVIVGSTGTVSDAALLVTLPADVVRMTS